MASGYYPLDRREGAGAVLAKISADLKALLKTEGDDRYANVPNCLPSPSDENTPEDAASDGGYRAELWLASRLSEGCLEADYCRCGACTPNKAHRSDCAVHNEPASPNGPCNCKPVTV